MDLYNELDAYLGTKGDRPAPKGTNLRVVRVDADTIAVRHHSTNILTVTRFGFCNVQNGGWESATTKKFLNRYLRDHGASIWQKNYQWYISAGGVERPFYYSSMLDMRGGSTKFAA